MDDLKQQPQLVELKLDEKKENLLEQLILSYSGLEKKIDQILAENLEEVSQKTKKEN